ncbi:unnamed protein product, partial [Brenthis ino]
MRTERQHRCPQQTGCRRLAAVDMPSLSGASPRPRPRHPRTPAHARSAEPNINKLFRLGRSYAQKSSNCTPHPFT